MLSPTVIAPELLIENIPSEFPPVIENKVGVSPEVATVSTAALLAAFSATEKDCEPVIATPASVTVIVSVVAPFASSAAPSAISTVTK